MRIKIAFPSHFVRILNRAQNNQMYHTQQINVTNNFKMSIVHQQQRYKYGSKARIKGKLKLSESSSLSKSLNRANAVFPPDLHNFNTCTDIIVDIDDALDGLTKLVRLGCSFDSFSTTLQKSMLNFMTNNLCLTSSQQIATFVHLLGKVGVGWNKLNSLVRGSVLSNLERTIREMESVETVHCLVGLTTMGVKLTELTPGLRRKMLAILSQKSSVMDMHCMVQIIGSLGYMGLHFDKCSREVRNSIVSRCGEALTTINHVQLNKMLKNLSYFGAKWSTLGLQFRSTAYVCIERLVGLQESELDIVDKARVAYTLYHLGRLQAEWSELPKSAKLAVERQLCEGGSPLSSASLRHMLSGLAAMGVDWNDNPHKTLQSFLLDSLAQNAPSSKNPFYIASIVRHLGEMKAMWSQLPSRLLEEAVVLSFSVQDSHGAITAEHVASVVCNLYSMEAAWSELSPQTRQCLHDHILRLGHIDVISVGAIAHAISVLTFDCDYSCSLLSSVRNHLMDTLDEIASHGIGRHATLTQVFGFCDFLTAQGVGLSAHPHLRDLYRNSTLTPDWALKDHELHLVLARATNDALQRRFGQYEIMTEFSPFQSRLFPMDFVVYKCTKLSAFVELDGLKRHYTAQGKIRRQSLFKEYLYRCRFPDLDIPVLRMRTMDARTLGVDKAGERLADMITRKRTTKEKTERGDLKAGLVGRIIRKSKIGKRKKTDESGGLTAKQKARADLSFN